MQEHKCKDLKKTKIVAKTRISTISIDVYLCLSLTVNNLGGTGLFNCPLGKLDSNPGGICAVEEVEGFLFFCPSSSDSEVSVSLLCFTVSVLLLFFISFPDVFPDEEDGTKTEL